jgi:hypothetical protein
MSVMFLHFYSITGSLTKALRFVAQKNIFGVLFVEYWKSTMFAVLSFQPSGESCLRRRVEAFFVALMFTIDRFRKSGVVAFREGLKTFALGWAEQRFASAPLFCCLITKVSISIHCIKSSKNQCKI